MRTKSLLDRKDIVKMKSNEVSIGFINDVIHLAKGYC